VKKIGFVFVAAALFLAGPALAAEYQVDKSHTSIGFSVKHMVISNVKGNFTDFAGSFTFDDKTGSLSKAETVIKVASINTNDAKRDEHLKSPDFLDAAKFSDITFKLASAEQTGGGQMRAVGYLTIHGVTKEVALVGEFIGAVKDPWGNFRAGFTASGVINRGDFGLTWNKVLDQGGVVVGEEVKLLLEVEGVQQKPAPEKKH
jgi:polyisoprenoid-binding protein YceI